MHTKALRLSNLTVKEDFSIIISQGSNKKEPHRSLTIRSRKLQMWLERWDAPSLGLFIQLIKLWTSQPSKKQSIWSPLLNIFFPHECMKFLQCLHAFSFVCADGYSFFFFWWSKILVYFFINNCTSWKDCLCFFLFTIQ